MTTYSAAEGEQFRTHGNTFTSFASSARGSSQLCAWRLQVPAGLNGVPHRPSREEVLLVLQGLLRVHIDGEYADLEPGSVAVVPAGVSFCVDGGPQGGTAWVSTSSGLTAITEDGTVMAPPWAQ